MDNYPFSSTWLNYTLIFLLCEKIIQHSFVTVALTFNFLNIQDTVAIHHNILILAGGLVAILFGVELWGVFHHRPWTRRLLLGLALFDIVGEFLAQGTLIIDLNVSFIIALILLAMAWRMKP